MSRTAKTILMTSVLALGLSAQTSAEEMRVVDAKGFDAISIDGLIDLNISQGKSFKVELEGTEKAVERVRTHVRDGQLTVENGGENIQLNNFSDLDDYSVTVHITMPDLKSLEVDGLSDVVIKDMKLSDVRIEVDGKADVDMTGSCNSAEYKLDGMAKVMAKKFKCKDVEVSLDGIGSARVYASASVDAQVDGLAKITVYGEPKKRQVREDGFGDVSFID